MKRVRFRGFRPSRPSGLGERFGGQGFGSNDLKQIFEAKQIFFLIFSVSVSKLMTSSGILFCCDFFSFFFLSPCPRRGQHFFLILKHNYEHFCKTFLQASSVYYVVNFCPLFTFSKAFYNIFLEKKLCTNNEEVKASTIQTECSFWFSAASRFFCFELVLFRTEVRFLSGR